MSDTQAQEAARLAALLDAEQVRTVDVDVMHSQAATLLRSQAARIAELEYRVHTCGPTCSKAGCINRRLAAEVEALRADAGRYQHIRSGRKWPVAFASSGAPEPLTGHELDAAIDQLKEQTP